MHKLSPKIVLCFIFSLPRKLLPPSRSWIPLLTFILGTYNLGDETDVISFLFHATLPYSSTRFTCFRIAL